MKLNTPLVLILILVLAFSSRSVLALEEPSREHSTDPIRSRKLLPEGSDPVWFGYKRLSPWGSVVAEPPKESTVMKDRAPCDRTRLGGGVIIAGLVTAFFAVVFAYIRVTRKKDEVPEVLVTADK